MEYLRIGLVLRPHGVQGAVKLLPLTDDVERFRKLPFVYIERNGTYTKTDIRRTSIQPDAVMLWLSSVESREQAEMLRDHYICVDREHAVKLPEGRYFVVDLIGCTVTDTNGNELGKLTDVLETGANDIYVISGEKKLLVPALKKLLHKVDVESKHIQLDAAVLEEVGLFED